MVCYLTEMLVNNFWECDGFCCFKYKSVLKYKSGTDGIRITFNVIFAPRCFTVICSVQTFKS